MQAVIAQRVRYADTVLHVESGLRTGDKFSPYPEQMNRHLVDQITSLHFAPTKHAGEPDKREDETDAAILVGTDIERIVPQSERLFSDADARTRTTNAENPYGDGNAADLIVDITKERFI